MYSLRKSLQVFLAILLVIQMVAIPVISIGSDADNQGYDSGGEVSSQMEAPAPVQEESPTEQQAPIQEEAPPSSTVNKPEETTERPLANEPEETVQQPTASEPEETLQEFEESQPEEALEDGLFYILGEEGEEQPASDDPLLNPAPAGNPELRPIDITETPRYLVDFYSFDGIRIASQYVEAGQPAVQPRPPERDGYAFVGWDPPVNNVMNNMETYATYQMLMNFSVVVNYYYEDGGAPVARAKEEFYMAGEAVDKTYLPIEVLGYTPRTPSFSIQTDSMDQSYAFDFVYAASSDTTYTVEYLFEQLDGSYAADSSQTRQLTGATGALVKAESLPSDQTVGFSEIFAGEGRIAADGSTMLQVKHQRLQFVITFDTGEGGTYIQPVVLKYGAPIQPPVSPARNGYTFEGWTVMPSGSASIPSAMPASDFTLVAKWKPEMVPYQVIYWLEKPNIEGDPGNDPDHYAFSRQETRQGQSGSVLSLGARDVGAVDYAAFGFAEQNVTVKGDGSTIVNVYFKRIVYTVTFSLNTNDPNIAMVLNGQSYTIRNPYVIRAKSQQDIGGIWPSLKNAAISPGFTGWQASFSSSNWVTHRFVFTDDMIPPSGTSYIVNAVWNSKVVTNRVNYWFEALPGSGGKQYVLNGVTYVLSAYDSQDIAVLQNSTVNAKAINGMGVGQRSPNLQFRSGGGFIGDYSTTNMSKYSNEYNFFYLRLRNTLSFNTIVGVNAPPSSVIPFGAPLDGYDPKWDASTLYTDINGVTYQFAGWYIDASYRTPFSFSGTMPNSNMTLFARWVPQGFTVTFMDGETELASRTAEGGGLVEPYTPVREGHVFIGWAKDPEGTRPFSYAEKIYQDTALYAVWNAGYTGYTVKYLLRGPGGGRVEGHADKIVQSVIIGSTATEIAATIPSYFPDSISKSLLLQADPAKNIIEFYYVPATDIEYTVRYLDAATGEEIPGVREKHAISSGARVVENYRAIAGYTPRLYQISAWLSADITQNVLEFWYDTNAPEQYTVQHMIQIGVRNDGSPIYRQYGETEVKTGSIGGLTHADPLDLPQYVFIGGNEPQVIRPGVEIHMILYYDALRTITFIAEEGGSLTGQTFFDGITSGAFFSTIPVPAPAAMPGYVFAGWDRPFPERIEQDWLFIARFEPIRELIITAGSASKVYNGKPLEDPTYTYNKAALMEGHALQIHTSGSITRVGKAPNVLSFATIIDGNGNDATGMYQIELIDGALEVLPASIPLVIAAASDAKQYDGTPLMNPDYQIDGVLIAGNVLQAAAGGSITLPGTAANTVLSWKVLDDQGEDVSENYLVSTVDGTLTVRPVKQPVVITAASAAKRYDGTRLTAPDYTVAGPLLPGDTLTAVVEGSITDVGQALNKVTSWTVTNEQGGDVSTAYTVDTVDGLLTVTASEDALLVTAASAAKRYDGTPLTDSSCTYDDQQLAEGHTLRAVAEGSITQVGTAENRIISWVIEDAAGADVSGNYRVAAVNGLLTVLPVEAPIVVTAASAAREYDGTPLFDPGYAFDETTLLPGDTLTAEVQGTITNVGSVPNTVVSAKVFNGAGEDVTECYNILTVDGVLTVLPRTAPVLIAAASDQKIYDGKPLQNPSFTYDQTALVPGHVVEAMVEGSITDVGQAANQIASVTIQDVDGKDVTDHYALISRDGVLNILPPERILVITAASDSKVYDGKKLSNPEYSFDETQLCEGHTLSVTVAGAIINVGSADNMIKAWRIDDASGRDVSFNYRVETINGILTVLPKEATLLIQAATVVKFYDGLPLTDSNYAYDETLLAENDELTATVEGSIVDVGREKNHITGYEITGLGGEDVTDAYSVTAIDGQLIVLPKEKLLVITAASAEKVYDGTPLTDPAYSFDSSLLCDGHLLTAEVVGSIVDAGTSQNTVISWAVFDEDDKDVTYNYMVRTVYGTLTILPAPVDPTPAPGPASPTPTPRPGDPTPTPGPVSPTPTSKPGNPTPTPGPVSPVPTSKPSDSTPTPGPVSPAPTSKPGDPTPTPGPVSPAPTPKPVSPIPTPRPGDPTPTPRPVSPTPTSGPDRPAVTPGPGNPTPAPRPGDPTPVPGQNTPAPPSTSAPFIIPGAPYNMGETMQ